MLFDLWQTIADYFKGKPYWSSIQSLFTLLSLYLTASVLAYQYLRWQYGLEPRLSLYFRSYLFKQISVVVLTIGTIGLLFRFAGRSQAEAPQVGWAVSLRKVGRATAQRLALVGLVLCVAVPAFISLAPHRADNIRVLFLNDPKDEFDRAALVYLLYELNQRQRQWYFEVDFDVFNKNSLATSEIEACERDVPTLCFAEKAAAGRPLIAITTLPLSPDHFWQNRGSISVISTDDWKPLAPPSIYEYLAYSVVTQGIVIHLNGQCSGLPAGSFRESRVGFGDLFEFTPRRYAMKPAILAARLTPAQEELLLNCFGAEYVTTAARLLSLDWLRSDAVMKNLERSFSIRLDEAPPSKTR